MAAAWWPHWARGALVAPGLGKTAFPWKGFLPGTMRQLGAGREQLQLCFCEPGHTGGTILVCRQKVWLWPDASLGWENCSWSQQGGELRSCSSCSPFPSAAGSKFEMWEQTHPRRVLWAGPVRSWWDIWRAVIAELVMDLCLLLSLPQHLDRCFFTMKFWVWLAAWAEWATQSPKHCSEGGCMFANTGFRWSTTKFSAQLSLTALGGTCRSHLQWDQPL